MFDRQGYGQYFLGRTWYNIYRLFGWRKNNNWQVLCYIIWQIGRGDQEKTTIFGEEKNLVPSRQRTGGLIHKIGFFGLRIASSPTLFFRSGPQRLQFVSWFEKMSPAKEISHQWGGHIGNGDLFCKVWPIVLFQGYQDVRRQFEEVHIASRL